LKVESLEDRRVLAFVVPAVNYDAGANPQAIVSADFNGGGLDLAVANYNDSTVSVLLGDGVGGFGAKTDFASGSYPLSLAVGDFDDDGNLDLATANAYDVSVLLGDGHGSFGAATSIGVAGNPQSVAVGDFNGDGTLDLGVTSNYYNPGYSGWYGWYPGYYTGYANVLLGNGDGTFSGPNATFIDSASANSALVADLNGDTYDDFVAFDSYGYVAVLLGDSSGYLQGPTSYIYTGDYSYAVAAGDVDGDGAADLVTANYYGNSVGVLLGTGSGTFGPASIYAAGSQPRSVAMAKFNGDNIIDLVTANVDNGTISVLLGTGTGFTLPVTSTVGSSPVGLAVGDFNGTGSADVASANSGSDNVSVLLNNGIWPALDAPSISLDTSASLAEGQTGMTAMEFNVTLSAAPTQTVTVHYTTADFNALAGDDYVEAVGTLTFTPTDPLTKKISVNIIGDRDVEYSEYFYLRLSDATNAFLARATGVGNIMDDEPRVSIDYGPVSVTEGNTGTTNAGFKVRLAAPYDVPVNVNFSTAEGDTDYPGYYNPATSGSDFQPASNVNVTFAPNETEKTILITVNGDQLAENTEYFSVNLVSTEYGSIVSSHAVGIIVDDEPRLSINSPSITEGDSGTKLLTFTVTLSAAYDQQVTVKYATQNGSATAGSDYVAISETLLTFAPFQTSKTFTVSIKGDKQKENDEYFYAFLSGASSNAMISNSYGIGTILTDDPGNGNGPPPGKGHGKP
jgi:hypothetical protein